MTDLKAWREGRITIKCAKCGAEIRYGEGVFKDGEWYHRWCADIGGDENMFACCLIYDDIKARLGYVRCEACARW